MIGLMLALAAVVLVLWIIESLVRRPAIKRLLNVVVFIIVILWLLSSFGKLPDLDGWRFPR